MALLDDVKSELAAIDNELPIAKKAQATAMIRFGNGLHSVDHHILVQAQLDSQDAAIWLQDTIRNLYGHEATLTPVSRQTPTGVVQRFIVRVPKGSAALVLQTGLYSRYTKNMVLGLPGDIINGKIAQIKAAWRGAFRTCDVARPRCHRTHAHPHGRPSFRPRMDRKAFRRRGPRQGEPSGELR